MILTISNSEKLCTLDDTEMRMVGKKEEGFQYVSVGVYLKSNANCY